MGTFIVSRSLEKHFFDMMTEKVPAKSPRAFETKQTPRGPRVAAEAQEEAEG